MITSMPCVGGLRRQRANDVVRLVAGRLETRDAERLEQLAHARELRAQVVRHREALGLVRLVGLVAEGGLGAVPRRDDVSGLQVVERGEQAVRVPEDGRHRLARLAHGQHVPQREVRAIDDPVAIEDHEQRLALGGGAASGALRAVTRAV